MLKKAFFRALLGAPIGICIGILVPIIISICMGDGAYHPVHPGLVEACGGELRAVILQTAAAAFYGGVWCGATAIWEQDNWSLLRQTVTHLLVYSLSALPIAWFMHWIPRGIGGILAYCGVFFAIYAVIWFGQYRSMKKRVQELNQQLKEL